MKRITDKDFEYVNSHNTDIREGFKRWRRKQAAQAKREQAEVPKIVPIKKDVTK